MTKLKDPLLIIALIVAMFVFYDWATPRHAPQGSFATQPSNANAWPRCDFDGNPANDRQGACPPWHGH